MAAKPEQEVGTAEELLLPYERAGQSAEEAGRSLFEAMESAGLDVLEDLDEPGESEPAEPEPKRRRDAAESEEESEDDSEDKELDDEQSEDALEDEDDDEDASDDEKESDEGDEEDLYEVTLPGGEKAQVTFEELQAGYSRTADYTRKRQRDAEEHRVEMESLRGTREEYAAKLTKLNEYLTAAGPQKPDPALRRTNPGEYAAQTAEYNEYQAQLAAVGAEQGAVDEDRQKELLDVRVQIVTDEREKLFNAVPEWKADEAKAGKELGELAQFAISAYGFTQEQLDSVVDHRLLLMLRENKQARDRRVKGKEKLEEKKAKPRRLKPGGARNTSGRSRKTSEAERVRKQLARRGGSLRDHARLFEMEAGDDLL